MEDNQNIPTGQVFDHIGYATKSLVNSKSFFEVVGYKAFTDEIEDHQLGVRILFLVDKSGFKIELLENLPGSEILNEFLGFGRGLYHLAYRVKNFSKSIASYRKKGFKVLRGPIYAEAFNAEVCFLMAKNGPIIELIDGGHDD